MDNIPHLPNNSYKDNNIILHELYTFINISIHKVTLANHYYFITIISVVNAYPGQDFDIARLYKNKQVKKLITAHSSTCQLVLEQFKNGDIEIEYFPMGSLVEKIRAAGSGLGGVLTPTGVGTLVEAGKQKLIVEGKMYLIELPLKFEVTPTELVLTEIFEGLNVEDIRSITEADFTVSDNVAVYQL